MSPRRTVTSSKRATIPLIDRSGTGTAASTRAASQPGPSTAAAGFDLTPYEKVSTIRVLWVA
jgi:hypothetical protein